MGRTLRTVTACAIAILAISLASCSGSGEGASSSPGATSGHHYKIALFTQQDLPAVTTEFNAFKSTFLKDAHLTSSDVTWVNKSAHGDNSQCAPTARQLATMRVDGYAVIGTPCILAMAAADPKTPLFALGMADPVGAGVAKTLEQPGGNVTGSCQCGDQGGMMATELSKIKPTLHTVGSLYDNSNEAMVKWESDFKTAAAKLGITVKQVGIADGSQIGEAARVLAKNVPAIAIGPDGVVDAAISSLAAAANAAQTPLFVTNLPSNVTMPGITASLGVSLEDLGAMGAEAAIAVLVEGKAPGNVAIQYPKTFEWTINKKALTSSGFSLPDSITANAQFVG